MLPARGSNGERLFDKIRNYPSTPGQLPKVVFAKAYAGDTPAVEPDDTGSSCIVRKSANSIKKKVIQLDARGMPTPPQSPPFMQQMQNMQQSMVMHMLMQNMQHGQNDDEMSNTGSNMGDMMMNFGNMMNGMFRMGMPSTGTSTGSLGSADINSRHPGLNVLKPKPRPALSSQSAESPHTPSPTQPPSANALTNGEGLAGGGLAALTEEPDDMPEHARAAPVTDHVAAMRSALDAASEVPIATPKAKGKAKAKAKSAAKPKAKGKAKSDTPRDKITHLKNGWTTVVVTRPTGQSDTYYKHGPDGPRLRSKGEVKKYCKTNKVKAPF
jgi:hypothetical protein